MASLKAKFPVLQELFAKKHRGHFAPQRGEGNPRLGERQSIIFFALKVRIISLRQ